MYLGTLNPKWRLKYGETLLFFVLGDSKSAHKDDNVFKYSYTSNVEGKRGESNGYIKKGGLHQ